MHSRVRSSSPGGSATSPSPCCPVAAGHRRWRPRRSWRTCFAEREARRCAGPARYSMSRGHAGRARAGAGHRVRGTAPARADSRPRHAVRRSHGWPCTPDRGQGRTPAPARLARVPQAGSPSTSMPALRCAIASGLAEARRRALACPQPARHRLGGHACLGVVVREQLGVGLDVPGSVRTAPARCAGGTAPGRSQQRAVGRVLDEGVFEGVGLAAGVAVDEEQSCVDQPGQVVGQRPRVDARRSSWPPGRATRMRTADRWLRRAGRHPWRRSAGPGVRSASPQALPGMARFGARRSGSGRAVAVGESRPCSTDELGQLFQVERHPVGLLHELAQQLGRGWHAGGLRHDPRRRRAVEAVEIQPLEPGAVGPGRREIRAEAENQPVCRVAEGTCSISCVSRSSDDGSIQCRSSDYAGARVDSQRARASESSISDVDGQLPLAIRREVERRVAILEGHRQQLGEQRRYAVGRSKPYCARRPSILSRRWSRCRPARTPAARSRSWTTGSKAVFT